MVDLPTVGAEGVAAIRPATRSGATRYSLAPGKGLTTVEFVVSPKDGGAPEVFRVFVSRG